MSRAVHVSRKQESRAGYAFLSPFFILFGIFGLLPIIFTFYVSFHDWDLLGTQTWVGLDNYTELLADERFYSSLGNTLSIFLLSSVPQLIAALLLAIVLNSKTLRFRTFWRSVILFPFITSTVAVAVVFGAMFADNGGMMNWALAFLGVGPIPWHADPLAGQIVIAMMVNWRWTGYNTLIFLAALQAIPHELYEAAEMDGVVPMNIRNKRSKMLRGLSVKLRRAFYESQLGTTRTVLFENENKEGYINGFTENYVKVKAPWNPALVNTLHEVELTKIDQDGLVRFDFVEVLSN